MFKNMNRLPLLDKDIFYEFNHKCGSKLSNFYACKLEVNGHIFTSSEQAYQYPKAVFHGNFVAADNILCTSNPYAIYKIGKSILCNSQWSKERVCAMKNILQCKFTQVKEFREELLSTDRKALVECTVSDFWGRGKHDDVKNMLGVLLMQLRHVMLHRT